MSKKMIIKMATVGIPLLIGLALYIWLRPDAWITKGFASVCPQIEDVAYCGNSHIIIVIRNHLADFLWAYAFMMCIFWIGDSHGMDQRKGMAICLAICFFVEVSQLINPYFTFDVLDLLSEFIGVLIAYLVGSICITKTRGGGNLYE